jgi:hypothetical protein
MAAKVNAAGGRTRPSRNAGNRAFPQICLEPSATRPDLSYGRQPSKEAQMNHQWHDTMVETPEPNGPAYVTGWTISGLAVIITIIAVWLLGI